MKRVLIAIALMSFIAFSKADQSAQTTPETYVSAFGRYRLTVFPLEDKGAAFGTHAEFMVRAAPPGQPAQTACEAILERWVGNSYEPIWRRPLVNEIAPESALVSAADGSFVTFDDWGRTGYGANVVVIYASTGDVVKKFALRDLIGEEQLKRLPRTIGSIHWGGHHILVDGDRVLELRVRTNDDWDEKNSNYLNIRIRLADGSLVQ